RLHRLVVGSRLRRVGRLRGRWLARAGRVVARTIDGAERIAGNPGELVRLGQVRLSLRRVVRAERDAAGAVRSDERGAVEPPGIEAAVVAPDRFPASRGGHADAQGARLVRRRERLVDLEPEIADASALPEKHDRRAATGRERDVADRRTVA